MNAVEEMLVSIAFPAGRHALVQTPPGFVISRCVEIVRLFYNDVTLDCGRHKPSRFDDSATSHHLSEVLKKSYDKSEGDYGRNYGKTCQRGGTGFSPPAGY